MTAVTLCLCQSLVLRQLPVDVIYKLHLVTY